MIHVRQVIHEPRREREYLCTKTLGVVGTSIQKDGATNTGKAESLCRSLGSDSRRHWYSPCRWLNTSPRELRSALER